MFLKTSFLEEDIPNRIRISRFIDDQFTVDDHPILTSLFISSCRRTIVKIFDGDLTIFCQLCNGLFHIGQRSLPRKRTNAKNPSTSLAFFDIDSTSQSQDSSACIADLLKLTILNDIASIRNIGYDVDIRKFWILDKLLGHSDDICNVIRWNNHIVSIANGCTTIDQNIRKFRRKIDRFFCLKCCCIFHFHTCWII